jgi:phospholipid transport system substrate-binding protein
VLVFATTGVTQPAKAQQDPTQFISRLGTQAIQVMGPSVPLEQRIAVFNQLFSSYFDGPRIAQFVLGQYARTATPEQRQQFMAAFQETMVDTYARRLGHYAGEPFRVTAAHPAAGGETVVSSQIVRPSGPPVDIEWTVIDEGGQPKVTDVSINGLSMRVQERQLFASLMQQSGNRMDIAIVALRQSGAAPTAGSSR